MNQGFGGWPAIAQSYKLGEFLLTESQATVVFPSVPQNFRGLRLVWQARADNNSATQCIGVQFNGDSGTNYDQISDDSAGVATQLNAPALAFSYIAGSGSTANAAASGVLYISNYAGTTFFKDANSLGRIQSGPSGSFSNRTERWSGTWKSTAAITSLTLLTGSTPTFAATANFLAGSYFGLYAEV